MTRTTRTGAPKARRFGAWTSGGRGVYIGVSRSGHCLRRTSRPGGLGSESCYFDAVPSTLSEIYESMRPILFCRTAGWYRLRGWCAGSDTFADPPCR